VCVCFRFFVPRMPRHQAHPQTDGQADRRADRRTTGSDIAREPAKQSEAVMETN